MVDSLLFEGEYCWLALKQALLHVRPCSGGSRISRGGAANRKSWGRQTIIMPNFPQKVHDNEKMWIDVLHIISFGRNRKVRVTKMHGMYQRSRSRTNNCSHFSTKCNTNSFKRSQPPPPPPQLHETKKFSPCGGGGRAPATDVLPKPPMSFFILKYMNTDRISRKDSSISLERVHPEYVKFRVRYCREEEFISCRSMTLVILKMGVSGTHMISNKFYLKS